MLYFFSTKLLLKYVSIKIPLTKVKLKSSVTVFYRNSFQSSAILNLLESTDQVLRNPHLRVHLLKHKMNAHIYVTDIFGNWQIKEATRLTDKWLSQPTRCLTNDEQSINAFKFQKRMGKGGRHPHNCACVSLLVIFLKRRNLPLFLPPRNS